MLSSSFAIALLAASAAVAHPIARNNNGPTGKFSIPSPNSGLSFRSPVAHPSLNYADTDILQYALTLEHLESTFYQQALGKFDDKDFTDAGLPDVARKRFVQISEHEKTHVTFLSTALGDIATKPCTYKL